MKGIFIAFCAVLLAVIAKAQPQTTNLIPMPAAYSVGVTRDRPLTPRKANCVTGCDTMGDKGQGDKGQAPDTLAIKWRMVGTRPAHPGPMPFTISKII